MSTTFKQEWQALKQGQAGHRFAARYESGKIARLNATWAHQLGRIVRLFVALGLLVVGVVLVFIPGPAIVFFFLSGGLLASESSLIARFLDWSELRLRAAWGWLKRHWQALPGWGKVVVPVVAGGATLVGGFLFLRLVV